MRVDDMWREELVEDIIVAITHETTSSLFVTAYVIHASHIENLCIKRLGKLASLSSCADFEGIWKWQKYNSLIPQTLPKACGKRLDLKLTYTL